MTKARTTPNFIYWATQDKPAFLKWVRRNSPYRRIDILLALPTGDNPLPATAHQKDLPLLWPILEGADDVRYRKVMCFKMHITGDTIIKTMALCNTNELARALTPLTDKEKIDYLDIPNNRGETALSYIVDNHFTNDRNEKLAEFIDAVGEDVFDALVEGCKNSAILQKLDVQMAKVSPPPPGDTPKERILSASARRRALCHNTVPAAAKARAAFRQGNVL